ncbi:VOC family protein [Paracoccus laeviglucosivorans]|uniref:Glyoxalase superfamily enzyme, possibly 3-demethylubiquinone-9 3-methyltransferase n=1 Tax=Paracoccus laeviglucosivorans TaxID=1197861 RepID=A0A521CUQ4_9RHOB|nr:VOC family protein [Paracoccus laeviglucosivorans]SMO62390.1 Glyoxalase superfamily enzyme, possibly 3-demethylubiquinone-9 3-methyltransferase [Paracoccus laeviglucosivorans]
MRVIPQLMFQGGMDEALALWRHAFPDMILRPGNPAEVQIAGQVLRLFESPPVHEFGFTPAISLLIECDDAAQVVRLAKILGEGGKVLMPLDKYDFADSYTWVQDRFGVSWQLVA